MGELSRRLARCGESRGRAGEFEWALLTDAAREIDRLEAKVDELIASDLQRHEVARPSNAGWQGATP